MFAGEISLLHGKYEELRLQLHQKDAELALKDVMGKEYLRAMLQALEANLETKLNSSIGSMRDDGEESQRKDKEQYDLLAKQIKVLTGKIDEQPEELLKLWSRVEEGKIEVSNLGIEVTMHFARLENLERAFEEYQLEIDAKFAELQLRKLAIREEGYDIFNVRDGSSSFVGRDEELSLLGDYFTTHHRGIQVVGGLGGMGKTQVALEYVSRHRESYGNKVRWIEAETKTTLDMSFRSFAESLGINVEKQSPEDIVSKVKAELRQEKLNNILLVFDNAESYEEIKDYLPGTGDSNNARGLGSFVQQVLITTRNIREWEGVSAQIGANVVRLEPFNDSDARKLIEKYLPSLSAVEDDITKLAHTFSNIPLALTQALSFIKINDIDIKTYLTQYNLTKQQERGERAFRELLEHDHSHKIDIYTTLSMNLESILLSPLGDKAIKILNICSYLHADRIPEKLFDEMFSNKIEAKKVMSILKGYSAITIKGEGEERYLYLHRLLQDIIRSKIGLTNQEDLGEAVRLVTKAMSYNQDQVREILEEAQPMIPHAKSLVEHCAAEKEMTLKLKTELSNLHHYCGQVFYTLAQYGAALKYYEESLSIRKQVFGDRHTSVAHSLNNIGMLYKTLGKHEEALKYYEESLSIYKQVFGDRHPDVATSLNNIGNLYNTLGRNQEALKYYEESLSIRKQVFGDRHTSVAASLNNIGLLYSNLGRNEEALKCYEESLSIMKQVFGDRHTSVATSLNNIGLLYNTLGQHEEALKCLKESLSIRKQVFGDRHTSVAASLNNIGLLYDTLGQHEEALKCYEESLSIYKQVFGDRHTDVATSLNNIGLLYRTLGQHEEALEFCKEALVIRREFLPESHPDIKNSLEWIKYIENSLQQQSNELKAISSTTDATTYDQKQSVSKKQAETKEKKCIISAVTELKYDNEILNNEELISAAIENGSAILLDNLITLGEDKEVADALIAASNEHGARHVVAILLGSFVTVANNSPSCQNIEDEVIFDLTHDQDNYITLAGET